MFAVERSNHIKDIMLEYKHINISSLAKLLSVTEATVRKDLQFLEEQQFLRRIHGGAVLIEEDAVSDKESGECTISLEQTNINEKKQIANVCMRYIVNGDVIFLGGNDTCGCVADAMANKRGLSNLFIITNNLYVGARLFPCPNITVTFLGGQIFPQGQNANSYGSITLQHAKELYVSKAFITVDAVSVGNGYMVSNNEYASLINIIKEQATETIVLADSSRVNRTSMYRLCDLQEIPRIITNQNVPDDFKAYCFEHDIKLYSTIDPVQAE